MTTMRDVARVAGVSAKTVSRVFNDDPHVTAETRERVRWAMQKLNYVPNLLARSFRAGADDAVGLAVPDIADPFFAAMTGSIEVDLVGRGMAVVITSLYHGGHRDVAAERERSALEALLRRQISGLIVACVSADQSYLAPWQERTPMVFVDRAPRGLSGVYVIEDDLGGAREAVTHLARHGHRRVAFLDVTTPIATTRRRLKGYRSALAENGLDTSPGLICMPAESPDEAAADLVKRLAAPNAPTAVFSSNILCTMAGPCTRPNAPISPWSGSVTFRWRPPLLPRSPWWTRIRPGSGTSPSSGSWSASPIPTPSPAAGPCCRSA
jgi:LacI family transcriptional regulator